MYDHFFSISKEKQDIILKAAISVFAENGYLQSKTAKICEKAGISKGLIFHYFGSKKNLFLFIVDHITEEMLKKYYELMPQVPMELFELLSESTVIKLKIAAEMPESYQIIYEAYINPPQELKKELNERLNGMFANKRKDFAKLIDVSLFKEEIDPEIGIDLIWACAKGLQDLYLEEFKAYSAQEVLSAMDEVNEKLMKHFAILKSALYRS